MVKFFKAQQKSVAWLTDVQIRAILDHAPEGFYKDLVVVLLETGMRLGEFYAIKVPSDIDLKNRILSITDSKTYTTRPARITDRLLTIRSTLTPSATPLPAAWSITA